MPAKIKFLFSPLFILLLLFFSANPDCLAEEELLREEVRRLEKRVEALEEKLNKQAECIKNQEVIIKHHEDKISEYESRFEHSDTHLLHREEGPPAFTSDGFRIGAGVTSVLQATNRANATSQKDEDVSDLSYSADIEIEKEFQDIRGSAFIHLETGQGEGVEDELTLFSNVNNDANNDNNVRVAEAWYEQVLFDGKALLTFGKLDPTAYFDGNEVANDETTQFLGRIFRNSPVVEFPDNTGGVRLAFMPQENVEFNFGFLDANSDWEDIGDNLFKIAQVDFKTKFSGREGNYRLLAWHSGAEHTDWLDTSKTKEDCFGFGFSIDQRLTENTSLFTRFGWQDPKVYDPDRTATGDLNYSLEYAWSLGFQIEGKAWARKDDVLAFAIGEAIPSDDYKRGDSSRRAKNEGHFETYYNIHINDYLCVSPDFHLIWNPFGKDVAGRTGPITIFGLRTQVDF